tara:strand:+ start:1079 stop:1468 length:390 start_codon:yes stop_codon:yes gene_type:complete
VLVQVINIIQNGSITNVDKDVITVQTQVTVVNKQMENVAIGQYQQMLTKLHLKFGQVVEQVAAEHAVTVVNTQLVDRVETTLLKQLPLHQVVHIQYVLVVHGLVVSHILAYQVWDVALTLTDITYLTSV